MSEEEPEIKTTITDPWLGKREIAPGSLPLIQDQLKLLYHYRDDGRVPSDHLLEDIKVYEYIVEHPQAEVMAEKYLSQMHIMRTEKQSYNVKKMSVAKSLGWFQ